MTEPTQGRSGPWWLTVLVVQAAILIGCDRFPGEPSVANGGAVDIAPSSAEAIQGGPNDLAGGPDGTDGTRPPDRLADGTYDLSRSLALTEEAAALQRSNDVSGASALYREAALIWPGNGDAWSELARLSRFRGDPQEAAAAGFVADRLLLYGTSELATQRAMNQSLKLYLHEQSTLDTSNPVQIGYATALSDFLDGLNAQRGVWTPLTERGPTEIERRDIPAAFATLSLIGGYIFFGFLTEPED